jgi:hypothetical protein
MRHRAAWDAAHHSTRAGAPRGRSRLGRCRLGRSRLGRFPLRPFLLNTRSTSRPFPLRRGTLVRNEVVSHTERRSANERQSVGNRRPTEELDPHACHDGCRLSSACPFQLLQPRDGSVRAARVCVHACLPRVQCMRAYRSGYQLRAAPSVLVSLVYRRAHLYGVQREKLRAIAALRVPCRVGSHCEAHRTCRSRAA